MYAYQAIAIAFFYLIRINYYQGTDAEEPKLLDYVRPITKEAKARKSEIFSTALKDGSKSEALHGKHSAGGKENLLPVQKKAQKAGVAIIGPILSMQYALERTRTFTAIPTKAFIRLHFLIWPIFLIVLAVC